MRNDGCTHPKVEIPLVKGVTIQQFKGKHPAGLVGTHINALFPVSENSVAWCVNYQEVIAMGSLFLNGKLDMTRIILFAGSAVKYPRLLQTRVGACINDVTHEQLNQKENTYILSGSILSIYTYRKSKSV